jgi:hypothetical protein
MVFAILLEIIFFGTLPSLLSATGAAIIISAGLYIAVSRPYMLIVGGFSNYALSHKISKKAHPSVPVKPDHPQTLEEGMNRQSASAERADETTTLLHQNDNISQAYS